MSKYPFSCECGSVFMSANLLAAHKSSNTCKPNAHYTLGITVKPGKSRSNSTDKCKRCGGKGYIIYGKTKDSKGVVTEPCCNLSEYEQFVAAQWKAIIPPASDIRRLQDATR